MSQLRIRQSTAEEAASRLKLAHGGSTVRALNRAWNVFWFLPVDSASLSFIRIATGLLLFYSHMIWALSSSSFFGTGAWLNHEAVHVVETGPWAMSLMWLVDDAPALLSLFHLLAILSALLLTAGLFSRVAAVLCFALTASFANRNPAALYGFDQVLGFLTLYLCVNPGHGCLSLDLQRRPELACPSTSARIALRLIQLHVCLLYAVAGLSKLKGAAWWSGVAFWGAIGSADYQTIDLTWLVHWPIVINLLTHVTVVWEVSYPALIWNRRLRPVMLSMALLVHAGIGLCFGMLTFGMAMLVANSAFISPERFRLMTRRLLLFTERATMPTASSLTESRNSSINSSINCRPTR